MATGKTAKSILISAAVRLAAFNLPDIAKMTSHDELDLRTLGERKRAIFCVIPDSDNSFNYLVGMLYTQAFQTLYFSADSKHGGELPVPVYIVMDEFANVALPDAFENRLSTMRSRRISVSIIIQNMAQLKSLFKDSWESIVGNCDTLLYLGGNEQSTHEYLSKMLGKATINTHSRGITKGQHGSSNTNYQNAGRELMTLDEVRLLDNTNALIFIRGERAITDKKFDILSHPNIDLTADGKAVPYKHRKDRKYLRDDLSFEFKEGVSNIVFDLEEGEILSNPTPQGEVLKSQTDESGVAVFYTVSESRTDENGLAEVNRYAVMIQNVSTATKPIVNALVKYIPAVFDADGNIKTEHEITVTVDENVTMPKGGQTQIAVLNKETGENVKDIRIRFIANIKKSDDAQKKRKSSNGGKLKCVNWIIRIFQKLKAVLKHLKK